MSTSRFKKSALATLVGCVVYSNTQAQTPPQQATLEPIEEVHVLGIRAGLSNAIMSKRDSTQFVDAISASDIGQLPDANVAESLQRVSGVQVDRGIGGGSDISIRGLRNNIILVNGRQVTEAGGRGSRGPDTLNSSSYGLLAMIPSTLVSRLEVSKQAGADEIEGALGGVVNIVTRKPLDHSGQQFLTSVTGLYSELSDAAGAEVFALYSNTFADDILGFQVSATQASNEVREDGLNTFSGYQLLKPSDLENTDPNGDGIYGLVNRDLRFWQINDERTRTGLHAIVQYEPTESLEYSLDTFYSSIHSDRQRYWTGFWNCCSFSKPIFSENEVLVAGNVSRPIHTNTEFADATSEFLSSAAQTKWFNEHWEVKGELAYTQAESDLSQDFLRLQTATSTSVLFDLTTGDVPTVHFPKADLTSLDGLNLAMLFDNTFARNTQDSAIRVDATHFLMGEVSSLEMGIRYNQLTTRVTMRQVDIRPDFALNNHPILSSDFTRLFDSPDFFSGETGQAQQRYLVVDENKWSGCETLNSLWNDTQAAQCAIGNDPLGTFKIEEAFLAAYLKANFETEWHGKEVSGNFGARYVQRDLTSIGNLINDDKISANTATQSHREILPSAVVKLDWNDDLVMRFGFAKVVSFPNTADLNNGLRIFGDNTGQGGSPHLNPFKINQFDASVEWYFDTESLLSAGLFYKDVSSFIVDQIQARNIPGFDAPITISQRVNGEGGTIQGLELQYQQPFSGVLANFGVMTTYSYIDSKTPFKDIHQNTLPIPGLSENNVNLVAYYENNNLGARLAYNWRDKYLDSIGDGDMGIFSKSYQDLVASIRYDLTENLSINMQAMNLLNTRQQQYHGFEEAIRRNIEFGRVFNLSITYAM